MNKKIAFLFLDGPVKSRWSHRILISREIRIESDGFVKRSAGKAGES
ncbi:MAG: hypothetical protein PHU03_00705 [Syntrophales bacterium]|nr:hypothetical protein [Syntrophales bacterium]